MNLKFSNNIKESIGRLKALKNLIEQTLSNATMAEHSRYISYKSMAIAYNDIAMFVHEKLSLSNIKTFKVENMANHNNLVWGSHKEIMEEILIETTMLLERVKVISDFVEDETENISNFISKNLRATIYDVPTKEKEIQNAIESLFIGRGMSKGSDYDRETGKFMFSGREYIPDFIISRLKLCIEVKLLKEGNKSQIIEEINADITAYSKKYERQLFVVYDLSVIRNETEFRSDIEKIRNVKVVIVKH